jgi:hypothetical protein
MYEDGVTAINLEGHLYVQRASNGALVWIGRLEDIAPLNAHQALQRVSFFLYWDGQHTKAIH